MFRCAARRPISSTVESLEPRMMLAAGDLDLSFGNKGIVKTSMGSTEAVVDVALDSSGSVYLGANVNSKAVIIKYTASGALDTSFAGKGYVYAPSQLEMIAGAIEITADDRVLLGGNAHPITDPGVVVLRYLPNGTLDTTWTGDGVAFVGGPRTVLSDLAVQGDGKVLACGQNTIGFEFYRSNTDGSPDLSFGSGNGQQMVRFDSDGFTTTPTPPTPSLLEMDIGDDGRIAAAGALYSPSSRGYPWYSIGVVQLLPNGKLDSGFDGDGKLVEQTDNKGMAITHGIVIAPDRKIIISASDDTGASLIRYHTNGARDTSFGSAGMAHTTANGNGVAELRGITVLGSGDIAAAGRYIISDPFSIASWGVIVVNSAGARQAAFSSDGIGVYQAGVVRGMAVQPNGHLVVAGMTQTAGGISMLRVVGLGAPVGSITGPSYIVEGGQVTLTATGTAPPGRSITAYEWDFDYNGSSFNVDATGASVKFWAGKLDGPATHTVALRVRDNTGVISVVDSHALEIRNTPPSCTLTNSGPVYVGKSATVTFSAPFDPSLADSTAGFNYRVDFDNDGVFDFVSTGRTHAVPAALLATPGNRTISGRVSDKDGYSDLTTVLTVWPVASTPPTVASGGPYTVNEGALVTLRATASAAGGRTIAAYEWDFNYDGASFNVDATGNGIYFSAAAIDGPASRTIAVRVRDSAGEVSAISPATVTIANVAPIGFLSAPGTTPLNSAPTVQFHTVTEHSAADRAAGLRYSYDWNDDGSWEVVDSTSLSSTAPASFAATAGTKNVRARIKDKDGGYLDRLASITVLPGVGSDSTPPKATLLTALRLRQTGGSFYKFTVRYTDAGGINGDSITSSDINVTGPGGFVSQVRLLTKTQVNSATWDGFYRLAAPGGTWDAADNGLYTINMNGAEVLDVNGNAVPPGPTTMPKTKNGVPVPGQTVPGQFSVKIIAPALVRPQAVTLLELERDQSVLA